MARKLKNQFGASLVHEIASELVRVYPALGAADVGSRSRSPRAS
jgi:hypothetical protein